MCGHLSIPHDVSVTDGVCLSPARSEFPMVLVANKADLEGERTISYQEGEELATQLKVSLPSVCLSVRSSEPASIY